MREGHGFRYLRGAQTWIGPLSILAGLIALWELLVHVIDVPEYLVPSPSRILEEISAKRVSLMQDLATTSLESALGFVVANVFSLLVATAFFYWRSVERAVLPLLIALKSVPIIATAPLLVLWFGYGLSSKVVMAAIVALFPLVIGAITGIRSVSVESVDLLRSLSATRWELLMKLCLPTAVPHIIAALKVSSTLAVVGAIVGELTGARRGLGFTILMASYNVNTPLLFAAIVLSAVVGGSLFACVMILERVLWRYSLNAARI
jgi:NitT/TauT family transport system permease protein